MKQLLLLFLLLCSASVMRAQDVIVKKDGSTILSKVLEVGENEVKYKRFDNLNGPTYTISKSELQAINYQNGAKDTFSTPKREENRYLPNNQNDGVQQYNDRALLALDRANHNPYKKAKNLKKIGWISGGTLVGIGSILLIVGLSSDDDDSVIVGSAMTGAGVISTSILWSLSHHYKKRDNSIIVSSIYQKDLKFSNGSAISLAADLLSDRTNKNNTIGLGLRYNF